MSACQVSVQCKYYTNKLFKKKQHHSSASVCVALAALQAQHIILTSLLGLPLSIFSNREVIKLPCSQANR